ncbi:MAG: cyclodeaminase/cyclohydrolase family protein [Planctomycetes bacterium]|nr:cyclodeaminase/cyclohydrolase family protein [Planctomycetota bacterium]
MSYRQESIDRYVSDAASNKPAPGGGSVSALVGALGVSMGCMVANFTVGKKKYKDVEPRVREILADCERSMNELLDLVQADVDAYSKVSAAYAMPKESDEEKKARTAAIQEALVVAMDAPLTSFRVCASLMDAYAELGKIGNKNLISDVGVAAILTEAALRGAKLNVEINLAYLKDEELVGKTREEVDRLAAEAEAKAKAILAEVAAAISK